MSSLPKEFLDWQVALRRHTMLERGGAPHIGVVPTVLVARPGTELGVIAHSVVCGLLPHPCLLEAKTKAFQTLYELHAEQGARQVYDAGIDYMRDEYYESSDEFDPESITTLTPDGGPLVEALERNASCALVFNVFDGLDRTSIGAPRCQHIEARAAVLRAGPVHDNVWWHNTLFHGKADEHVVVHFRATRAWDTRFGMLRALID